MRLAKYLAHAGVASRRAAEAVIAAGRVRRRRRRRSPIRPRDVALSSAVTVDGRPLAGPEPRVLYALNKPLGVVSTARDTHGRPTVLGLVPRAGLRLYPVGTPGRRLERADPAHQRRRARQPADPSPLRGAEDLLAHGSAAARSRERALARAARAASARGRPDRARAGTRGSTITRSS